jgi:colanic acid biosynthesis glycosyl transferase WcaI
MITMVPHYPSGHVTPEYRKKWLWRSMENGVEVIRVGLPSVDRSKLSLRYLQYLVYQLGTTWSGLWKKYDVVLAGSSSLSAWLPFFTLAGLRRKPAVYAVYDVYPGVGVKLGIFRNRSVLALVTAMEKYCLNHATIVRIISDSFRQELHEMGVPDEKMALVYDWVDTEFIHPMTHDNSFVRENGLIGKFVVLYAGNLGLSQGLETVLASAEILAKHKDISFVFVGEGTSHEHLVSEAGHRQLKNVKFIPFQPRERLPEVMASADISLVVLQRGIGNDSIPSKTFSIFASGRPVIASIDEGSGAWKLIEMAEAGLCIPPDEPVRMADAILKLKNDDELRKRLGANGRDWAEQNHSPMAGAKNIEMLLKKAILTRAQKD